MNRRQLKFSIFESFARDLCQLAVCRKRAVAAIVFTADFQKPLAIGYNGPPVGANHDECTAEAKCGCLHAEVNALLKLEKPAVGAILLTTLSPCITCAGYIINAGITCVVYCDLHSDTSGISRLKRNGVLVCSSAEYYDML